MYVAVSVIPGHTFILRCYKAIYSSFVNLLFEFIHLFYEVAVKVLLQGILVYLVLQVAISGHTYTLCCCKPACSGHIFKEFNIAVLNTAMMFSWCTFYFCNK